MARGYARGRARDEAARAALEPLAPGERPRAVTFAALLAALLGASNLALLATGYEVDGGSQSTAGALIFAGLMGAAAIGMWRARYWAVLGLQVLLAISLITSALFVFIEASPIEAVIVVAVVIVPAGMLFWFLVRAMARIQMPERR